MRDYDNNHDLRLPDWGPYTKKYIGISHIADKRRGHRFDLGVFPGLYRRKVDVPNVLWESGYHPWEALPDLTYYAHRHELEWKDRVYADISFTARSDKERLIRAECVNRTGLPQQLVLHSVASLHGPQLRAHGPALCEAVPELPQTAVWTDALDYAALRFANPRPSDGLVYDGMLRGEARVQRFVGGSGLGAGFGADAGDNVSYRVELPQDMPDAVMLLRYRVAAGETAAFRAEGLLQGSVRLPGGNGEVQVVRLGIAPLAAGAHTLELTAEGGAPAELDGFVVAAGNEADEVRFVETPLRPVPALLPGPLPLSLLLRYEGTDTVYGVLWTGATGEIREFYAAELDRFMRFTAHDHVRSVLSDEGGEGHFADIFLRPIPLAPESSRTLFGLVCCGTEDEVRTMMLRFVEEKAAALEAEVQAKRTELQAGQVVPAGGKYAFGQQLMAATLATNVVFPVYVRRGYIRHYTPGRWWDSLYTWDSGFIGLGLAELDPERAADCLNAYVTDPGDPHAAFIHHGSMVPVQAYLFQELWNRHRDRGWLAYFYPRLRQYYLYFSGQAGGSTTNPHRSGLLQTWDYFYNSGGWDDYPPQLHVHRQRLTREVAPVSVSCHAARFAKLLAFAAETLGHREHLAGYEADAAAFAAAVNEHAWDGESGYYGYVRHDETGAPAGILRHESGVNYNMGLDGTYPLVAGICDGARGETLLAHLRDGERLWSPIGLSTVDRRAPYYSSSGYWNGAVWMAHQWFYWKMMLDCGQADDAWRIASTALALWEKETAESYHCFEHFMIETGRGAGWHQFGGLSAPVLSWFAAYHRIGRVTAGFDVWMRDIRFDERHTRAELIWTHRANDMASPYTVLVCLRPGLRYTAASAGGDREIPVVMRHDGLIELRLSATDREMNVRITGE
ncbi:MGH1-like glycoside hydrolase domain-containing protein [Paenibacillus cymbidii]|uniref:MGH1-like glycoside hydrolase domain-containing protein n=1 Tax=Paenibacillus cymbidii TaxID=1639034 RepID=UPI0010821501|nr:trehalase family glycosidase [Paenibacillus cymbidii]